MPSAKETIELLRMQGEEARKRERGEAHDQVKAAEARARIQAKRKKKTSKKKVNNRGPKGIPVGEKRIDHPNRAKLEAIFAPPPVEIRRNPEVDPPDPSDE